MAKTIWVRISKLIALPGVFSERFGDILFQWFIEECDPFTAAEVVDSENA